MARIIWSSVWVLLMTLRRRWLPASGATVRLRAPVSAMARISGTLIGSMRMELALILAPMRCNSLAISSICVWSLTAALTRPTLV